MPLLDSPLVRSVQPSDAVAIARIYNYYVLNTIITFEEEPVDADEMAARLAGVASAPLPWLVVESGGEVVGYAYASPWKSRRGYRFSVESSVYLHPEHLGHGWGSLLYAALLDDLRQLPIHTVIGGVALPNAASVRLHEKLGFRKVAHFSEVGLKFGRWIDVGYWQLLLNQWNDKLAGTSSLICNS